MPREVCLLSYYHYFNPSILFFLKLLCIREERKEKQRYLVLHFWFLFFWIVVCFNRVVGWISTSPLLSLDMVFAIVGMGISLKCKMGFLLVLSLVVCGLICLPFFSLKNPSLSLSSSFPFPFFWSPSLYEDRVLLLL